MTSFNTAFPAAGGASLAPSSTRGVINLTSANQAITTTQMGGTLMLQTGDRLYPNATIPTFASVTVGSQKGEVELQLPPASPNVAIFNSGVAGTDATLEEVLNGDTGADVLFKATAQSATGAIKKLGHGRLRTLWPLDPTGTVRNIDSGVTGFSGSFSWSETSNNQPMQACALSGTLSLYVFVDSNDDVKLVAANCNADGSDRAESPVTTLRSNANSLRFANIGRISDSIAVIQWWDHTASANEFCAVSVTDANPPVITVGAVADDTVAVGAAADRPGTAQGLLEPDFNSASNFAFWFSGTCSTVGNGQRAYRCSINSGTLAITINSTLRYSAAVTMGNLSHKGVSPAADRFLCIGMNASSDTRLYYLQYSAGSVSQVWMSNWRLDNVFVVAGNASRLHILNTNGDFLLEAWNGSATQGMLFNIPDLTSGNNHRSFPVPGFKTIFASAHDPRVPVMVIEGEAIHFGNSGGNVPATTDLYSMMKGGRETVTDVNQPLISPWKPFAIPSTFGSVWSQHTWCVHPATRRVTLFTRMGPASGNIRIFVTRYAWPRR